MRILWCLLGACAYPLAPPETSEKCLCPQHEGSGWSSEQNRCLSSSVTSCLECPSQQACASLKDLAGDGLQIFLGDCRSSSCAPATESSFAFAVSLALDQQGNVFFSDQGNNRIRMLEAERQVLITVAGTGQLGFAGDGGPGRRALLRHPEGLALKPRATEVYFADFLNQRLRKLVKQNDDWIIYTVAGTGVMAADASCSTGCAALEASLFNPRALAFASNQDLYFIESGSEKILKLTTSLGDPSESPPATLSTFAGHGEVSRYGLWPSFRGVAKLALPGHYRVPNSALTMSGLNAIGIDQQDRLWTVDSDNNRIFMLPLTNDTKTVLVGDFGHYLSRLDAFSTNLTATEREELRNTRAEALKNWLPLEFPDKNLTLKVETNALTYEAGYSYWMYGEPVTGMTWCSARSIRSNAADCDSVSAQLATFGGITSVCFDGADNLYLVDNEDSQIVYVEDDTAFEHSPTAEERTTEADCPCEQYWVEDYVTSDGEVYLPGARRYATEDIINLRSCRQNPELLEIIATVGAPDPMQQANLAPNCTAVDYCASAHSDSYPKWCYINVRNLDDSEFKTLCSQLAWSWCSDQTSAPARWRFLSGSTILGNEKRFETIYLFDLNALNEMQAVLSEDLWVTQGMPLDLTDQSDRAHDEGFFLEGTAILKGFVDTGSGPQRCGDYCCGLPKLREFTSTTSSGWVCLLRGLEDLTVMEGYYQDTQQVPAPGPPGSNTMMTVPVPVLTVFEELESLVYGVTSSTDQVAAAKLDFCKSRCLHDDTCTGYMVKGSGTELISAGQPCIFFSQNQPFYVYTIARTSAPFVNGAVNLSSTSSKYQALGAFVGPSIAASRLTDPDGIYVSNGMVKSKDMISGPHLPQSLLLTECQELCLEQTTCTGIAFPGCYLLKKENIKLLAANSYSIMVKEKVQPKVKSAIGYSQADAYNDEPIAQQSYLNRPLSCAVDSAGDLLFADNNFRLRKITNWATSCSVAGGFSIQQVQAYELALNEVNAACNATSVPELQGLYAQAQQEVLVNSSLELVEHNFCNFGAGPKSTELSQQTNNLYILCIACSSLTPRPTACPWLELCSCRDAMAKAAALDVHVACPQRNAVVDPWHRWITAFTSCWASDLDATQWSSTSNMATLRARLQALG